jgi:DNA mismatch repair protein MutS
MRQVALIAILGQMGAPVPAREARWGSFSSVYTRIGAHDAIARGQSTFMVEMNELAHLLHHADERSLIVLDEVGRGTSTFDGMSVAWSTLEWITERIGARTLFATHYHELTQLEHSLPRTQNAHLAVEAEAGKLRFLYELRAGASNESFGIHVAQLAGIPTPVIDRAWEILRKLETPNRTETATETATQTAPPDLQLSLFTQPSIPKKLLQLQAELKTAEVNEMTPLQALQFVVRLQDMSRESAKASS